MSASKKEEIENEQLEIEMSSPKKKTEKAPKVKKEEKTVDKKDKKETTEKKEDKAENKKEEGKKKAKEIKKIATTMREKANDGKFVLAMIILGIMILLFGLTNVEE